MTIVLHSVLVLDTVLVNDPAKCYSSLDSNWYCGDMIKLCVFTFNFLKPCLNPVVTNGAGAVFSGTRQSVALLTLMLPKS